MGFADCNDFSEDLTKTNLRRLIDCLWNRCDEKRKQFCWRLSRYCEKTFGGHVTGWPCLRRHNKTSCSRFQTKVLAMLFLRMCSSTILRQALTSLMQTYRVQRSKYMQNETMTHDVTRMQSKIVKICRKILRTHLRRKRRHRICIGASVRPGRNIRSNSTLLKHSKCSA